MIRKNIKLAKRISSNIILKTQLLITKKKLPDCFADFITLLTLIPHKQEFSKERLRSIAKDRFPRLFNSTTYKRKKIKPFEYFFTLLQSNFYHTTGIIHKVNNNKYYVDDIQNIINESCPHLSLFSLFVDDKIISEYNHNCSEMYKDAIFKCIEELSIKTDMKVQYTWAMIKRIFGLTKPDIKKRLRSCRLKYCYRTIGQQEAYDMELNDNLFKGNHKYITGFRLEVVIRRENNLQIDINFKSLYTILKRIEKQQYSFSIKDFFYYYIPSVGKDEAEKWSFIKQYERLGYKCINSNHFLYRLKSYVESVNIGVYKQCMNIYNYLSKNFDELYSDIPRTFKSSLKSLKCQHVYQLPVSSI